MASSLLLTDPLSNQAVTIMITLPASDLARRERPLLVSIGIAKQLPVVKSGTFASLMPVIKEAWTAFGVRAQAVEAASEGVTIPEERVVATVGIDNDAPAPMPPSNLTTAKPPAQNLSLF